LRRFRFRLARVKNVRQLRERMREVEFGQARARLERERDEERRRQAMVSRGFEEFASRLSGKFSPVEAVSHLNYVARLKDQVVLQTGNVKAAAQRVATCQAALLRARQERKALDSLYDRKYAEYMYGAVAEDQKVLDDIPKRERR
jgi:flagellar export protein FliJ